MGKNCAKYEVLDSESIKCTNKKGDYSYVAQGLTLQQAQPLFNERDAKQAQRARDLEQLTRSIQQLGNSTQSWGQQFSQQSQQYRAPEVRPFGAYGGSVTYTIVGDTLLGSNGVTYRKVGQSVIGSDGTSCQVAGQINHLPLTVDTAPPDRTAYGKTTFPGHLSQCPLWVESCH